MSEPIKDIIIIGPSDPPSEGWFGTAFFDLGPFIQSMDVSLSMNGVSQLSIVVSDHGLVIQSKNILQVRRWIAYLGMTFEISVCEIRQGSGGEEVILECRSKPCQEMKREKGRNLFTGGNATLYAGYNDITFKFFLAKNPFHVWGNRDQWYFNSDHPGSKEHWALYRSTFDDSKQHWKPWYNDRNTIDSGFINSMSKNYYI